MRMRKIGSALLALTLMTGCAGMTDQEQRAVSGGAAGAAGGALLGAVGGNATLGAALGGPVGVVAGLLYYEYAQNRTKLKNGQSKEKQN